MQITAGAVINDRFVVLGRIGVGAVAEVYLAKHMQLGSLHAIKVLQIPTPAVRGRLLREGRLQSTLRDPHIVPVTDVVEIDGSPCLVMDFVRGPSLEKLLQHLRFDLDQAIALGTGILLGMRTAHQAGMIHRDLKPANVLVEACDARLVPKVADFGLAKLLGAEEIPSGSVSTTTRTGSTLGTPAYMAPEQIRDARSVDERADVFALGTILYEILTGCRAFPGDDLLDLFNRIREGRYRPVRELLPDVPPRVEAAITSAIETERDRRLGSVAELLDLWTDGRGERAAEIDWPAEVLTIALSLVPDPKPTLAESGPTSATFDLDGGPPDAAAATVEHAGSGETIAPELPTPFDAAATTDTGTASLETPTPAHTPAPPAPPRTPQSYATAAVVLSFSLSVLLVCAGAVSVVAVGLAIGWLQPGPKVPVHVADPRNGPLYSPHDLPKISSLPEVEQRHAAAWQAVRGGDLEGALAELDAFDDEMIEGDIGLRLLTAAAEVGLGEPAGYRRIEQAADAAKSRQGPLPDLARIANEAIRSGPDIERIRRHMKQWPEDELAVLLLARLDGLEGERKLELLNLARGQDPDAPGPSLLLAEHWLDRANLREAEAILDDAEARFPGNVEVAVERSRWLLLSGRPAEARVAVERSKARSPSALEIHAAALRELGDLSALDSIHSRLPYGDHASRIAFARGRSEAAFGLGAVEESLQWLDRAFTAATRSGRLDDAAELARIHQQFAALLQRPSDLSTAIERARGAASMLGMPKGLHDRLTARILLLDGLLALEEGDLTRVQPNIERLEEADRGERLANILRSAQLAHQGERTSSADLPAGCAGRMIGAKWLARAESNEVDSIFSALSGPESPCARTGIDRYVRADAESYLALSAVARGDIEDAQRHIEHSRALVPDATVDLPIFERNADAEERIATRDL